jgi:hypothetical protein
VQNRISSVFVNLFTLKIYLSTYPSSVSLSLSRKGRDLQIGLVAFKDCLLIARSGCLSSQGAGGRKVGFLDSVGFALRITNLKIRVYSVISASNELRD